MRERRRVRESGADKAFLTSSAQKRQKWSQLFWQALQEQHGCLCRRLNSSTTWGGRAARQAAAPALHHQTFSNNPTLLLPLLSEREFQAEQLFPHSCCWKKQNGNPAQLRDDLENAFPPNHTPLLMEMSTFCKHLAHSNTKAVRRKHLKAAVGLEGDPLSPSLGLAEGPFTGGKAILCFLDTPGPP